MVMLMTERLVTVMMGMEMMLSDLPSGPPRSTGAPLVSLFLQRTTLFVCSTTRVTNSAQCIVQYVLNSIAVLHSEMSLQMQYNAIAQGFNIIQLMSS